MPTSPAEGAGALGGMWGEAGARALLARAGFVDVTRRDPARDPLHDALVARVA